MPPGTSLHFSEEGWGFIASEAGEATWLSKEGMLRFAVGQRTDATGRQRLFVHSMQD